MKKSKVSKRPPVTVVLKNRRLDEADLRAVIGGGGGAVPDTSRAHINDA